MRRIGEDPAIGASFRKAGASTLASGELTRLGIGVQLTRSGGCQFQPVPYAQQLLHKKRTVELAYERYSRLAPADIPPIQDTIPSPKEWAYRTKITPHFDAMPKWLKRGMEAKEAGFERERDNAWKGLTDIVPEGQKKKGKGKGKGVAVQVEKAVEDEEAMNGDAAAEEAATEEAQNGDKVEGMPEGKKEKKWELRIGFEGKGKAGVLDIEVSCL